MSTGGNSENFRYCGDFKVKKQRTKRSAQEAFDVSVNGYMEKSATNRPNEEDVFLDCEDYPVYPDLIEESISNCKDNFRQELVAKEGEFDYEDALNYVAAIFLKNNISESLGKDIFSIASIVTSYSSIKFSHVKKRIEEWKSHEKRMYSFCSICDTLLDDTMKCKTKTCRRFCVPQHNVAGNKTIVTFSIRTQLQHLIDTGVIEFSSLENRTLSLSLQLRNTPKYVKKTEELKKLYPDKVTLLMSLNMDGFRRRGSTRGEFWPLFLAIHEVSKGTGNYREYRPEFIILSALLQSGKKMKRSDFASVFERMHSEIESIRNNPLIFTAGEVTYQIIVELYQCVFDMDASKKIHGLPVWLSYSSCSRCDVEGKPVKLKKRKIISWHPSERVCFYDDVNTPVKLIPSRLPPPWKDGFDGLHLIYEGTSRDILKELLGKSVRTKRTLRNSERQSWAIALSNTIQVRGMCSTALLDPLQLSCRTGSEVQQIFDISIPTILMCIESIDLWAFMIFLHWLTTRIITDHHLCSKQCVLIIPLSRCLTEIVGNVYPALYSMKFHFVHDHMVHSLMNEGSPLLNSAAPFERLNQVLGRSLSTYTTRATMNMASRFIALQQAAVQCARAVQKTDSPVPFPSTFQSEKDIFSMKDLTEAENVDSTPLVLDEAAFLSHHGVTVLQIKKCIDLKNRFYATRRSCTSVTTSSNVCLTDSNKAIKYGSIERIFVDRFGVTQILLKQFQTEDPFIDIVNWAMERPELVQKFPIRSRSPITLSSRMINRPRRNPRSVLNIKQEVADNFDYPENNKKEHNVKRKRGSGGLKAMSSRGRKNGKFQDRYESDFIQEEENENELADISNHNLNEEEQEELYDTDSQEGSSSPFNKRVGSGIKSPNESFSISANLAGQHPDDPIDTLRAHVECGDIVNIGRDIQKSIRNGTMTEIQLMEFAESQPQPQITMTSFVNLIDGSNLEDIKSILVGQQFMMKMSSTVTKSLTKFEAKLNSISSNIEKKRHINVQPKRQLLLGHNIASSFPFPAINLATFFTTKNFTGDKVINQLTNLYSAIFRKYLPNEYDIWVYSFRPLCAKATDRHFKSLPEHVLDGLQTFGLDVLGAYLPSHLLCGPIDECDPFVQALGKDGIEDIKYRRTLRDEMSNLINSAIGFSLQALRNYHFDLEISKLVYCSNRKNCITHYRWDDVKVYRQRRRTAGVDVEDYTIDDVMRSSPRSNNVPVYDETGDNQYDETQFEENSYNHGEQNTPVD